MPLFVCEKCGCIDDTNVSTSPEPYCTECDTGEWHHLFEKVEYDPNIHVVINRPTNITLDDGSEVSFD